MKDSRNSARVGHGYDIHRFSSDPHRKLVLGGVHFPGVPGLDGHSDADCLLHAVADAILGAAGLPDIGDAFPPGDPACQGIESTDILRHAVKEVTHLGWALENIDVTVVAEHPRIAPRIAEMKERIADVAALQPSQVGIKATTNEGIGGLGSGEGIAAHAVCLLTKRD